MARPTSVALWPPGSVLACTANTGKIKNKPNMRKAKIEASEALERISARLMRLPMSAPDAIAVEDNELFILKVVSFPAIKAGSQTDWAWCWSRITAKFETRYSIRLIHFGLMLGS